MRVKNVIYVYNDLGSNNISLSQLLNCLKSEVGDEFSVNEISASSILQGDWVSNCRVLCFGGGYDLGFLRQLGEKGCNLIRKYVLHGGNYLGICAGAYFACKYIEFDKGGSLEVIGDRYLKFCDGSAIGAIYPGFEYDGPKGAYAAPITNSGKTKKLCVFYKGGCMFKLNNHNHTKVLYTYDLNLEPAIVACKVGEGIALLSGVHFEYDSYNYEHPDAELINQLQINENNRQKLVKYLLNHFV